MKLSKLLSVLVVCFVILSNSFLIGYAADVTEPDPDDVIMYGLTHSELLEYGYIYYGEGAYGVPEGIEPIENIMPSLLLDTAQRYPNFNPSLLPWSSAPSYIQDIVYMDLSSANTTNIGSYKMPFIFVRVVGAGVDVYVGLNIGIGIASSSGAARICYLGNSSVAPLNVVCYHAAFDKSYNLTENWTSLSASTWGDTGNIKTFNSSSLFTDSWDADIYLYGGNGVSVNRDSSTAFVGTVSAASTSSATVYFLSNNLVGFGDSRYFYNKAAYTDIYVNTFKPLTAEEVRQQQQNTLIEEGNSLQDEQNSLIEDGNKTASSILDKIKDLPSNIANSIKGFFTSLGDRISGFFDNIINVSGTEDSTISDYNDAESDLTDDYNPDNLNDDLNIDLDANAVEIVFQVFDTFLTLDNGVFSLFISIMAVGIISLILGR